MFMALRPFYNRRPSGDDYYVTWIPLGLVKDMEEAKRTYGGSPVLEWVKQ